MKLQDYMNTGLLTVANQIQGDWLQMLRHNYTPQTNEPFSLSILPHAAVPATPRNILASRGSSDDVLARLKSKVA